jgi:hypothetical protein
MEIVDIVAISTLFVVCAPRAFLSNGFFFFCSVANVCLLGVLLLFVLGNGSDEHSSLSGLPSLDKFTAQMASVQGQNKKCGLAGSGSGRQRNYAVAPVSKL